MAEARSKPPAQERGSLAGESDHGQGSETDAVRIASAEPLEDPTEAVEAEVPADNIARISDATLPSREELAAAFEREAKAASGRRR